MRVRGTFCSGSYDKSVMLPSDKILAEQHMNLTRVLGDDFNAFFFADILVPGRPAADMDEDFLFP